MNSTIRKSVSILMAFVMGAQPMLPLLAADDPIISGRDQARSFFSENQSLLALPSTNGGSEIEIANGEKVTFAELFQAPSQDSSAQDYYSLSDADFIKQGLLAREELSTGNSVEGQAFRTLRESAGIKNQTDVANDPIWSSTDAVFDLLDGEDIDCSIIASSEPDYKECNRLNTNPSNCLVDHEITIVPNDMDLVFIIDNSGSMGGVINQIRTATAELVAAMTQNRNIGSLRIGAATSKHYASNYIDLGDPAAYSNWISRIGSTSGTAMSAATLHILNNFSWRDDPKVSKAIIIVGNNDAAGIAGGMNSAEIGDLARSMGVDVYVYHNVASVKQLGTWLGNGYTTESLFETMKSYLSVFDEWSPQECIDKAFEDIGAQCYRSVTSLSGGNGGCVEIGGFNVCPGDIIYNQISEPPLPGIDRLSLLAQVSEPICNFADGRDTTCAALKTNPQCGFITAQCADGTPAELATEIFLKGLERAPNSQELDIWTKKIQQDGYEKAKEDFYFSQGLSNSAFFDELSCMRYVERYDCSGETGRNAACGIKDLFEESFADCQENITTEKQTTSYTTRRTETCEQALKLTSCTANRSLQYRPRSESKEFKVAQCSLTPTVVTHELVWPVFPAYATTEVTYTSPGAKVELVTAASAANRWRAQYSVSCPGVAPSSPIAANFSLFASGYYVNKTDTDSPAEDGNDPCLRDTDNWTTTRWTCVAQEAVSYGGNAMDQGARETIFPELYPNELTDVPPGYVCTKAVATYDTAEYGAGEFCSTNLHGVETCVELTASQVLNAGENNCAPLEARVASDECTYVGRFPVSGGQGSTGYQYIWEDRYSCEDQTYEKTSTVSVSEYSCEGIVRCMGNECVESNSEKSSDFGRAAAMLAALQEMGNDVVCDIEGDVTTCEVFGGEAQTCKMALGGWVDCCESISGVSLTQYITLMKTTARFDTYLTGTNVAEPIKGAYTTVRDPLVKSYQYLENTFTTTLDGITGDVGSSLLDGATAALDTAKQAVMDGANQFLKDQFGDQVAGFFFEQSATGATALASGFATALSVIGMIYTIYTIADLLVNIIWECSEEELQLAVDVELKKTVYVGSYCAKEVELLGCIEKRKSYCIFSSPLARIINEQGRAQLRRPYGNPEHPDCSGIAIQDLDKLDWEKIDLQEWMSLLDITGNYPGSDGLDLESMTGSGSFMGSLSEEERLNTADRNVERLEESDLWQLNNDAEIDLWDKYIQ